MDLKDLLKRIDEYLNKEVTLQGWIKSHRKQKEFGFIEFSDGTSFEHLQLVYDNKLDSFDEIQKLHLGCAITVKGIIVKSEGAGQAYELKVNWSYTDEEFATYQREATIVIVHEKHKLYIVELQ